MAKAILNGVNPYTPLPSLAEQWICDSGTTHMIIRRLIRHASVISLPLGLLNYKTAALLWFFFELISILASICLISLVGIELKTGIVLITFISVLGWTPVIQDLWYGQLNTFLLLLLLCAWFALRDGKNIIGGAILGGMIALKLCSLASRAFSRIPPQMERVLAAAAVVLTAQL